MKQLVHVSQIHCSNVEDLQVALTAAVKNHNWSSATRTIVNMRHKLDVLSGTVADILNQIVKEEKDAKE